MCCKYNMEETQQKENLTQKGIVKQRLKMFSRYSECNNNINGDINKSGYVFNDKGISKSCINIKVDVEECSEKEEERPKPGSSENGTGCEGNAPNTSFLHNGAKRSSSSISLETNYSEESHEALEPSPPPLPPKTFLYKRSNNSSRSFNHDNEHPQLRNTGGAQTNDRESGGIEHELFRKSRYIRQLSKEELLHNYFMIEQLRRTYIAQIEEIINGELNNGELLMPTSATPQARNSAAVETKPSVVRWARAPSPHEVKVFDDEKQDHALSDKEFGFSNLSDGEENYIVEAYNKDGEELVIGNLQITRTSVYSSDSNEAKHESSKEETVIFEQRNVVNHIASASRSNSDKSINCSISSQEMDEEQENTYMSLKECMSGVSVWDSKNKYEYIDSFRSSRTSTTSSPKDIEEIEYATVDDVTSPLCSNGEVAQSPKEKKDYIVQELVATEAKYISDLEKVVKEYKPYLTSKNLSLPDEKQKGFDALFGNIELIYETSKLFYEELKECGYDHEKVAGIFVQFKTKLFGLYPDYSKNKPYADTHLHEFKFMIQERQRRLNDRLDLACYLLTPIQRLGKYILFLQNISKELAKKEMQSDVVEMALNIVKKSMAKSNDYIAIDSIKDSPINLEREAGSFIMRENFNMIKPKRFETVVFLFEEIIVFTTASQKAKEEFIYVDSIRMTELTMMAPEEEPTIFYLKNFPKCKKGNSSRYTYTLEAKSPKLKQFWSEAIEKRLWEQLNRCREQVHEMYGADGLALSQPVKTKPVKSTRIYRKQRNLTLPDDRRRRAVKVGKRASTFYIPSP